MSETAPQQFVTVLSFSRCGSSLLARVLDRVCGVSFGEPIEHQSSTSANPEGYFENEQIVRINDDLLKAGGGSVFQPPEVDFCLRLSRTEAEEHIHRMRMVITLSSGSRPYFGWKDPRTAYTLPLWRLAVPTLKAVIIVRDPRASSASYQEQYGTDLAEASWLWFDTYYRIFRHSAGMPRHLISFETLVAKPVETVLSIAHFLGVERSEGQAAGISSVIRPDLIRFSSQPEPAYFSAYVDPNAKFLHNLLLPSLESGGPPDYAFLGSVLSGLQTFERMRSERAARLVERRILERDEEIARLRVGLELAERLAFERMDELKKYDHALGECQALLDQRNEELSKIRDQKR